MQYSFESQGMNWIIENIPFYFTIVSRETIVFIYGKFYQCVEKVVYKDDASI